MGKRRSLVATKSKAAPGENNALGGTLDEYFNSKAAYQPGQMLGLSSPSLLKHLLVGSATNNAMQTDKDDDDVGDANAAADSNGATQEGTRGSCEDARDESVMARSDDKDSVQEPSEKDACESPTKAASEPDAYDEDYESESSSSNADTSVAGMTLSDYLHAKAQDDDETDKEDTTAKPKANKTEPKPVKKQAAAAAPSGHKKSPPPALISGMSLDHYLGAVEGDDACDDMADSKSPVSKARAVPRGKQPALMLKSSNHISNAHSMLPAKATNISSNHYSHDQQESTLTPYQRRLKKKSKPKLQPSQQQSHGPSHGSIGTSILLMDAHSSSSGSYNSSSSPLIIAKSMNTGGKDKKKHYYAQPQQGSYQQQPPLPKLQASASLHSLGHREHESSSDELELEANEKLPPL